MKDKEKIYNKINGFLLFKNIPIIALIFPPIGIMLLLNYLLNKNKPNGD